MAVHCQFKNSSSFTVGTLRELACDGDFSSLKLPIQLQFQSIKKQYTLYLLKVKSFQPHQLILTVTSYQPGSYNALSFEIADGFISLPVNPLSWEVSSVIQEGQISTPHPPYGPWVPSLPFWYMAGWGFFTLLALTFIFIRLQNWRKRKKIVNQVRQRLADRTPVQYFIKQMGRFISHQKSFSSVRDDLEKLNQYVREFLENYFYISTQDSLRSVLKNNKIKSDQKITQILVELQKSLDSRVHYSKEDMEQLLDIVRSWVFDKEKVKPIR